MNFPRLEKPFESVEAVIEGLTSLETSLRARKDRRAIFASAYVAMSKEIASQIGGHRYHDSEWVARYAISFGNLYRRAFLAYETGDFARLPRPWMLSFETSRRGKGLLFQDLLLGMNAHINYDLALALKEVSIDPLREQRREDHFAVNAAIKKATDPVQDRIISLYAPVLRILDRGFGRLDEDVANFSIEKARLNAWVSAISLADAGTEAEEQTVTQSISNHAAVMARLILLPSPRRRVLTVLQLLERVRPWWHEI